MILLHHVGGKISIFTAQRSSFESIKSIIVFTDSFDIKFHNYGICLVQHSLLYQTCR